jgi:hypothetical protein
MGDNQTATWARCCWAVSGIFLILFTAALYSARAALIPVIAEIIVGMNWRRYLAVLDAITFLLGFLRSWLFY